MVKILLVTPSKFNSECAGNCDFELTDEQKNDLQRIYGSDGGIQIETVSCDDLHCWYEITCVGKDCDVFAVCPCLIQEMFVPSFVDIVLTNTKPIITFIDGKWIEVSVKNL